MIVVIFAAVWGSLGEGILFVALVITPFLIVVLTKFNLKVAGVMVVIWLVGWAIPFAYVNWQYVEPVWVVPLLLWWLAVPLLWLIPAVAGRESVGKTETTTIEYAPYTIREK